MLSSSCVAVSFLCLAVKQMGRYLCLRESVSRMSFHKALRKVSSSLETLPRQNSCSSVSYVSQWLQTLYFIAFSAVTIHVRHESKCSPDYNDLAHNHGLDGEQVTISHKFRKWKFVLKTLVWTLLSFVSVCAVCGHLPWSLWDDSLYDFSCHRGHFTFSTVNCLVPNIEGNLYYPNWYFNDGR